MPGKRTDSAFRNVHLLAAYPEQMPWYRFFYTPSAAKRAWIAAGRQGPPPSTEFIAEFETPTATHAHAEALHQQLMQETGSSWVWVKEVPPPAPT